MAEQPANRSSRNGGSCSDLFGTGGDSPWMQPPFSCDYGTNYDELATAASSRSSSVYMNANPKNTAVVR
jgi:hypothetical protein